MTPHCLDAFPHSDKREKHHLWYSSPRTMWTVSSGDVPGPPKNLMIQTTTSRVQNRGQNCTSSSNHGTSSSHCKDSICRNSVQKPPKLTLSTQQFVLHFLGTSSLSRRIVVSCSPSQPKNLPLLRHNRQQRRSAIRNSPKKGFMSCLRIVISSETSLSDAFSPFQQTFQIFCSRFTGATFATHRRASNALNAAEFTTAADTVEGVPAIQRGRFWPSNLLRFRHNCTCLPIRRIVS